VAPATADDVVRIVRAAIATKTPVRIRGGAHSANHSTFPNRGELLVSTARLTDVVLDSPSTVSAGGGVPVVALSKKLADYGVMLPVVNDGWSGPTVGGYISAGGMGAGSARHGGFWANVASVTIVTFRAETITLERSHPDFLWLFGSMGQLGIIVSARLDVVPQPDKPGVAYKPGERFALAPQKLDSVGAIPVARGPEMQENLRWFTLLVEEGRLEKARADLERLQAAHASRLRFRNVYEYHFAARGKNPPLFFGRKGAFVGIGVWAELDGGKDRIALAELERDFSKMVVDHDYRRYIQSEVTRGPPELKRYFGPALYEHFRSTKRRYDPHGLLNPGAVFE
jgi:FAD/FMN-containing dehydrogenase